MHSLLENPNVERLVTLVEEATRSTEEGVKRFVEPGQGTLRRAINKRHHIVFGRRGSGKSSLLRKAAADLTVDRRPIAYVDLEIFKGHTYPDVLISILISTLKEFNSWLGTAAINPANKASFWQKLFGTKPARAAYNRERIHALSADFQKHITELEAQLHSSDNVETVASTKSTQSSTSQAEIGANVVIGATKLGATASSGENSELKKESSNPTFTQNFNSSISISSTIKTYFAAPEKPAQGMRFFFWMISTIFGDQISLT